MPSSKKPRRRAPPLSRKCTAQFEQALRNATDAQHYRLRLYITGTTARSSRAITNIRSLCDEYLPGRYDLEVIDLYQQPGEAAGQQIIAAPTLVKEFPVPLKRLVGDLSDRDKVLIGLDLENKATDTKWLKV